MDNIYGIYTVPKKTIKGNEFQENNFSEDKLIEFLNNSEDQLDIKIKDLDNNDYNDENKSDNTMDLSIHSVNNSENGEEEEIITLTNNDNNNININNNLFDLFDNIKIDDNNENINENNNNISNIINNDSLDKGNNYRFKKTLKERLSDRIRESKSNLMKNDKYSENKKLFINDKNNDEIPDNITNNKNFIYPKIKKEIIYPKERQNSGLLDNEDSKKNYNYPKDKNLKKKSYPKKRKNCDLSDEENS